MQPPNPIPRLQNRPPRPTRLRPGEERVLVPPGDINPARLHPDPVQRPGRRAGGLGHCLGGGV